MFIFLMFPKKDNISPRIVTWKKKKKNREKRIGHLHDDVILLLRPEFFRVLLSCANWDFCFLSSLRLPNLKWKEKQKDAGRGSKMMPSCKWPVVMWILTASGLLSFGFTETKLQHFYLHISLFANVCLRFKLNRTFYKNNNFYAWQ